MKEWKTLDLQGFFNLVGLREGGEKKWRNERPSTYKVFFNLVGLREGEEKNERMKEWKNEKKWEPAWRGQQAGADDADLADLKG